MFLIPIVDFVNYWHSVHEKMVILFIITAYLTLFQLNLLS